MKPPISHARRSTRRGPHITVMIVATAISMTLNTAGCESPDTRTVEDPSRGQVAGPPPSLSGADTPRLTLPSAPPATIDLPRGGPAVLKLPEGATTEVTDTGAENQVDLVLDVPAASLGFELDATAPTDPTAARQLLSEMLQGVEGLPGYEPKRIRLEGFASAEGEPGHNQALSAARATWVHQQLVELGVDPNAITSIGRGASSDRAPVGPGPEDRRVEITITLATRVENTGS